MPVTTAALPLLITFALCSPNVISTCNSLTAVLPLLTRPVPRREFAGWVCVTLVTCSKRLPSCRLVFFNSHLGVTKTYGLGFVAFFGYYYKLLSGVARRPLWLVVPAYARSC